MFGFLGVFHAEPIKITNFRLGPIKEKVEQIHILRFPEKVCQPVVAIFLEKLISNHFTLIGFFPTLCY